MTKTTAHCPTGNAQGGSPRRRLRKYVVRFTDWTAYRLDIEARNAEEAVEIAKLQSCDIFNAFPIDGGQEGFEAIPAKRYYARG